MKRQLSLFLLPLVALTACGPKRTSQGLMDDPRSHADRGKQYWDKGENQRARDEFRLALELDKKFAPALAGMAMVEARDKHFKEAYDLADQAIVKGKKQPDGWIAKGVVITEEKKGGKDDDWTDDAAKCYRYALDIDKGSSEAYYRLGTAYTSGYKFREAGDAFRKVLDLNKTYTDPANQAWTKVQKIERAAPGTRVGKKIALVDSLTRADAAALFIAELEIDRLMGKARPKMDTGFKAPDDPMQVKSAPVVRGAASDVSGHWAGNFIEDVLKVQIRGLQLYPDGRFVPNQALTRVEFAFLVEDALMISLGDRSLATKYIGNTARFNDVGASSPYFNAVCNAVDKNIMQADPDGTFGAMKPVSGADALLSIRTIKELRR